MNLLRRRALGDVVLVGSVTAALGGGVTLVTDPAYAEVGERLRGVSRVLPWGAASGLDLQGVGLRKGSVRRRLRLLGLPIRRPDVPTLYGRKVGVAPRPAPWIDAPGGDGLALVPGAATPLKRWSPASLAAVGRAWPGPVVVVGGPTEAALVARVAAEVPGAAALVEAGFRRTIDALGRCRAVVGGDTGLVHLAAACGAVPVTVFGPTHPDDGFFPYPGGRAVGLDLPCRPCSLGRALRCRVGHHGCVGVSVDAVLDALGAASGVALPRGR